VTTATLPVNAAMNPPALARYRRLASAISSD
jgi:hypothetical protein